MNETQLPSGDSQSRGSKDGQPSHAMPAASTRHTPTSNEQDDFLEEALLEDEATGWSAQFVVPFQQSGPMPAVNPQPPRASTNQTGAPAQGHTMPRRFPLLKVALISTLIVLAVGFLALSVFAQPATHLTTAAKNPTQEPLVTHTAPTARPTRAVQKTPTPTMT